MEEKVIKLNRNIFCLELMAFFPLVFLFGVGGYFIHGLEFENDIDKIFIAIGFVVEVIVGIIVAKMNNRSIVLSENSVDLRHKNKLLKSFPIDSIKGFVCDDNKKTIKVLTHNSTEDYLLKFVGVKALSEMVYFDSKAELCKKYPTKSNALKDEYINSFLESGEVPQYISSKNKSDYCRVVVGLLFGFILTIIPIGLTILSVLWALMWLIIFALKLLVLVLNLFN